VAYSLRVTAHGDRHPVRLGTNGEGDRRGRRPRDRRAADLPPSAANSSFAGTPWAIGVAMSGDAAELASDRP
jgi:hypothetical protein